MMPLGPIGSIALVVALVGGAAFVMLDLLDARASDLPRAVTRRRVP